MMPEMDGIEAAMIIRASAGMYYKTLPIIALTANVVSGMREMFLEKGFNDLLAKPIDIVILDELLGRWLPKEKKEPAAMEKYIPEPKPVPAPDPFCLLPGIPGVNIQNGIAMTGGSLANYMPVLELFSEDVEKRLPVLEKMPEELPRFIMHVHALKSASAAVGAADASAKAAALENAGKRGDMEFVQKNLGTFADQMRELARNIKAYLKGRENETGPSPGCHVSNSECRILLHKIAAALGSQNAAEIDGILGELEKKITDIKNRESVKKISGHVLMAEYDSAMNIVDSMLA
jgi:CheY-like chemotaxis protein